MEKQRISFVESLILPLFFISIIWLIHFLQWIGGNDFGWLGIYPREAIGLKGIIFAPLIHDDWTHLSSNTVPFLVLSTMIIYFFSRVALRVFMIIYFVTGFLVWAFAWNAGVYHIGLSYEVYGLVSFVFWTGVFRRSIRSIVLALIVTMLYSGMFAGLLPTEDVVEMHISWDSHLYGACVGFFMAYFFKEEVEEDEIPDKVVDDSTKIHFFASDTFDKTLEQRWQEAEEQRQREAEENRWRYFS